MLKNSRLNYFIYIFLGIVLLMFTGYAMGAKSQPQQLDVRHPNYLRAVLLSKLVAYIYWPDNQTEHLVKQKSVQIINICVLANDQSALDKISPYFSILDDHLREEFLFKIIDVSKFIGDQHLQQALPQPCNIYYLTQLDDLTVSNVIQSAKQHNILTLCDSQDNLNKGAMMGLIQQHGRLQIYINRQAIDDTKIRLKSSLLRHVKLIE